jgi:hypothetical protein
MMRRILIGAALLVVPSQAEAISKFSAEGMSCQAVQQAIDAAGAAIVRYPSATANLLLYGRYVRNRQFCRSEEYSRTVYIRTADTHACPVKTCTQYDFKPFD